MPVSTAYGPQSGGHSTASSRDSLTGVSLEYDDWPLDLIADDALWVHGFTFTDQDGRARCYDGCPSAQYNYNDSEKCPNQQPQRCLQTGCNCDMHQVVYESLPSSSKTKPDSCIWRPLQDSNGMSGDNKLECDDFHTFSGNKKADLNYADCYRTKKAELARLLQSEEDEPCREGAKVHKSYTKERFSGKLKHFCSVHTLKVAVFKCMTLATLVTLLWILVYLTARAQALPGGSLLALLALYCAAAFGGGCARLTRLPQPVGLLGAVILMNSLLQKPMGRFIEPAHLAIARVISVAGLLTHTGSSFQPPASKRELVTCFRLALLPLTAHALCVAVGFYFLVLDSWLYSFIVGLVLACSNVPTSEHGGVGAALRCVQQAAGLNTVISTLALCATLAAATSSYGVGLALLSSLLQPLAGLLWAVILGLLALHAPAHFQHTSSVRLALLLLSACVCVVAASSRDVTMFLFTGCGLLAVLTAPLVTFTVGRTGNLVWEKCAEKAFLELICTLLKPLAFGLVVADVKVVDLSETGFVLVVVICVQVVRLVLNVVLSLASSSAPLRDHVVLALTTSQTGTMQIIYCLYVGATVVTKSSDKEKRTSFYELLKAVPVCVLALSTIGQLAAFTVGRLCAPRSKCGAVPTSTNQPSPCIPTQIHTTPQRARPSSKTLLNCAPNVTIELTTEWEATV